MAHDSWRFMALAKTLRFTNYVTDLRWPDQPLKRKNKSLQLEDTVTIPPSNEDNMLRNQDELETTTQTLTLLAKNPNLVGFKTVYGE